VTPVTWSIIARDDKTGQFGIAAASKFFAVGALVPHIASGIGAVATQALINPFFGLNGLQLLRDGKSTTETVNTLVAADAGRDHRQLHVMDKDNRIAAHTGERCVAWCGHRAGEAAGGDKRGKQSAALLIHGEEDWPDLDLRVDDHADPLAELERLERVSRERFVHFARFLPSKRDPVGITDRDIIEYEVAAALAAEGFK